MNESNKNKSLPWWVEILFVQIGLPDNWLRKFLISRKKLKISIKENRNSLWIALFGLLFIIYCYPIRKEASLLNHCVKASSNIVKSKVDPSSNNTKDDLLAYSINFCKGGRAY